MCEMYTSVSVELISRVFRIGEILAEFGMTLIGIRT